MDIHAVRPQELSADDLAQWRTILEHHPQFNSPFLHPTYAQTLAAHRPQVEVAVWRDGGRTVGFFPFERHQHTIAKPLGIKLADYQGVVADPSLVWTSDELLDGARLTSCHYDHFLADQPLAQKALDVSPSPVIDLRGGYQNYIDDLRTRGSQPFLQTPRKRRKLEREHGSLVFTWQDTDDEALRLLFDWKSAQRRRTGTFDILGFDWVRAFLQQIVRTEVDGFCGLMSTLRADGRIVAVHLGLQTPTTLHYWFPAFDTSCDKCSPGLLLMLEIAAECERRGIGYIDLGKGNDPYKDSFATTTNSVATGVADRSPARQFVHSSLFRLKTFIKQSPLQSLIRWPKRMIKQWTTRAAMGTP